MRQSFHPKKFDDHDETSFVRDSDAVTMRKEPISKSFNPKTSRDHRSNRIRFEPGGIDMVREGILAFFHAKNNPSS